MSTPTAEERANSVWEEWATERRDTHSSRKYSAFEVEVAENFHAKGDGLIAAIAAALYAHAEAVRAEEREACAKVADDVETGIGVDTGRMWRNTTRAQIATAIRARK